MAQQRWVNPGKAQKLIAEGRYKTTGMVNGEGLELIEKLEIDELVGSEPVEVQAEKLAKVPQEAALAVKKGGK